MKTFTISARNASREFEGNDLDTVVSVLSHAATRSFFGFDTDESADAINEALDTLIPNIVTIVSGGNAVELKKIPESFRNAMLNAVLEDGAEIEIDYYAVEDNDANEVKNTGGFDPTAGNEEPTDEDYARSHEALGGDDDDDDGLIPQASQNPIDPPQGTAGTPRHGIVTVSTNGGMVTTQIEIEDGVTTVRTVIYNPVVLNRAGMDETAMSNCMVNLNGDIINPNNINIRKLHAGDTLDITPRFASKLGAE